MWATECTNCETAFTSDFPGTYCHECGVRRERLSSIDQLHAIEDAARYVDPDSSEYFELMRRYSRVLNQMWQGPIEGEEIYKHEQRRRKRPGKDYFRARTIAQNAINKLEEAVMHRARYEVTEEQWPELAIAAAKAVRKIRPDLFEVSNA